MDKTLLIAGVVCLVAAIVGGGLKAFGIEIPALKSTRQQVMLGILGVVLLVVNFAPQLSTHDTSKKDSTEIAPPKNLKNPPEDRDSEGEDVTPVAGSRPAPTEEFREAQILLNRLGYRVGPPDGFAGPLTRATISRFQEQNRLNVTGEPNPATLATMRRAVEDLGNE